MGNEEGGIGSIKSDHVLVRGSDLFIIEEPGHLDVSLLIVLLQSAFELQTFTFFLDLQKKIF